MGGLPELQIMLRRYALGLWRWRWVAVGVAWLLCAAGWAVVASIPNVYEANARLYVDADEVLTPLLRGLALDNSLTNQLDMLQRTLLSRPNLEKLISKTDLALQVRGPYDEEAMVANLARAIRITPQTRNLFTISYRNARPRLAYDVVQTVLSIFVESKTGTNRADMENARQFLAQQIASYEGKLRAAEAQRAAFTAKYLDLLPDANGASKLDAARSAVVSLQEALKQARLRLDLAEKQLASTPSTVDADSPAGLALIDPGSAEPKSCQDLDAARVRYTDRNPTVIALRAQCAEDRKHETGPRAIGRGTRISNPVAEKLKLQVFDLQVAIASLTQQLTDKTAERDKLEAVARGAPGIQAQYTDMNRDYDVLRRNYEELIARREAMRIAAAADTDAEKVKLQVIDPPQVPELPVAPNRLLLTSVVLPLGLAGGVAAALLLQTLDTSFHTLDELRDVGLPVLGAISLVARRRPLIRRLASVFGLVVVLMLLCAVYGGLILRLLHKSAA